MVVATLRLQAKETPEQFRIRMRVFCKDKLPPFKIPQKVRIETGPLHTERQKKLRTTPAGVD
ncbi:MAG: long-chain fatty acid--CoA ligase, partial [candidate division Zixibacteria bacterium]|nr:long-chain fatty acid--CoA ligase [candidate division Zixibacteria bacterium]